MSEIKAARTRPQALPESGDSALKSERTRARILDEAMEFLWNTPFRDLTVSTLMAGVGVSRPSFYQYFEDLHDLMGELLRRLRERLLEATRPWFVSEGDPRSALSHSISALVGVAYAWGPFIRAVADAATTDEWFERTWFAFLGEFDDAVAARIEEQQSAGWIPNLDAHTIAVSLNRLNLSMMIFAFGRRPRKDPKDFAEALTRIWTSTLYAQAPRDGS